MRLTRPPSRSQDKGVCTVMSAGSITAVTIIVGLLGVLVIGLLSYMSSLVRRAYELKVELRSELERGLAQMEGDIDMRSKKMRQDVQDDVTKLKNALRQDVEQRHAETLRTVNETVAAFREQQERTLADHVRAIEDLRRRHKALLHDVELVNTDVATLTGRAPRRAGKPGPQQAQPQDGQKE